MAGSKLLKRLIAARYRPSVIRQEIVQTEYQANMISRKKRQRNSKHWTGVYNGIYYRIPKVPTATTNAILTATTKAPSPTNLPILPKLYTPTSPPAQLPSFTPVVGGCSTATATTTTTAVIPHVVATAECRTEFWERFMQWLYENYSTLILNFGSICTLIGFTRSDVLELRCLSVTGSLCAIVYHMATPPLRIPPLLWSSTFAVVNGYKIYEIVQEREGSVQLSTEQEEMYIHFFMPHGVTPKQFEMIYTKAEVLCIKKGTFLIRQNEAFQHVDLVVSGTTRAFALGRFLTAASTTPTAHEERAGGASGAWIGEMCILERVWMKEQKTSVPASSSPQTRISNPAKSSSQGQPFTKVDHIDETKQTATGSKDSGSLDRNTRAPVDSDKTTPVHQGSKIEILENHNTKSDQLKDRDAVKATDESKHGHRKTTETPTLDQPHPQPKLVACRSMYTIVAQEDCTVLRWRHADMERLMEKSTDMRAALTRAMTAAIVGKVINFTISRSRATQTWATWLSDWKYNAGAEIHIGDDHQGKTAPTTTTTTIPEAELSNPENFPNYPIKRFG
jgi:Popeye protein conserved region